MSEGKELTLKNIEVHIEMMVDDEMRLHAFASTDHDIDFQVFRLLSGYRDALTELVTLRHRLAEAEKKIGGMREENDKLCGLFRHLLCVVNKVTAAHRHGQKICESDLDNLANTQIDIEHALKTHKINPG